MNFETRDEVEYIEEERKGRQKYKEELQVERLTMSGKQPPQTIYRFSNYNQKKEKWNV